MKCAVKHDFKKYSKKCVSDVTYDFGVRLFYYDFDVAVTI